MTTFFYFRNILFSLLLTLCATVWASAQKKEAHHYLVVLDLSDRLLASDQINRDKAIIEAIFGIFEQQVRKNMMIYSNDSFKVSLVPQEGGVDEHTYTSGLYINMQKLSLPERRTRLEQFRKELPQRLQQLYKAATTGKTLSQHFRGADIWRYFNDNLAQDTRQNCQNYLYILTDGYFDFESNRFVGQQGNRRTDSQMITRLRKSSNWRTQLAQSSEGLIPIKKSFPPIVVQVFEIQPKSKVLDEQDLLIALWKKWLSETKLSLRQIQPRGNIDKITELLE